MQVQQYLTQHLGPENVEFVMENYPPTPTNAFLAKIVTMIQMGVMGAALLMDQLGNALNMTIPPEVKEKKMMILMGAWFIGNTVNNALTSTGAFEIYFDDSLVFSKLGTGRMPGNMEEVLRGIESIMRKSQ